MKLEASLKDVTSCCVTSQMSSSRIVDMKIRSIASSTLNQTYSLICLSTLDQE
ncbi:hypothetical protein E2C01_055841 [Portunus trituberculatus]|uniref:Uncharacterized protein n=1 Tax=Portunus trituberculatus TaxID=210409 RepID=A0A5B7GWL8_PORTR|nr:hypothetical protein [Portunus trituberculatus]